MEAHLFSFFGRFFFNKKMHIIWSRSYQATDIQTLMSSRLYECYSNVLNSNHNHADQFDLFDGCSPEGAGVISTVQLSQSIAAIHMFEENRALSSQLVLSNKKRLKILVTSKASQPTSVLADPPIRALAVLFWARQKFFVPTSRHCADSLQAIQIELKTSWNLSQMALKAVLLSVSMQADGWEEFD